MILGGELKISDVLTAKVASVSEAEALQVAQDVFDVAGEITPLTSERDQNFRITSADGAGYVLKITNPAEDRSVTNMQTQALLHIASVDPGLPVPKVFPCRDGKSEPVVKLPDGTSRIVRLLSFMPGEMLNSVARTKAQRNDLGQTQARLDLALRGFFHPAAGHELLWDIKHSGKLRPLLEHIKDKERNALATKFLDGFERNALPVMPKLRGQVIHNDFQPWNVLVDAVDHDKVAGVIDFGDLVYAPMIDDLAVACAYHLGGAPEPLDFVAEIVAGYNAVLPLEDAETDILFDLIAARLVMTVAITGWRAALHPENATYILRNNPLSWEGLERFDKLGRQEAQAILRDACRAG
ncbi:MAG: phosphotransferase [Alphaproteobacteria bacterium]|nr:phosphotransferase [Alphaproteobacteria bacterium]